MKYLVLVVVLVVAYMLWRNARLAERAQRDAAAPPQQPPAATALQDMVSCRVCGLHLPQSEAVAGVRGLMYCSAEHRLRDGG
ncbi:MAG TPA: PP0621 family protein [Ramlibacter sp.]